MDQEEIEIRRQLENLHKAFEASLGMQLLHEKPSVGAYFRTVLHLDSLFPAYASTERRLLIFLGLEVLGLRHQLTTILERLQQMTAVTQEQHDQILASLVAISTEIGGLNGKLGTISNTADDLEAQIKQLQTANPSIDFTDVLAAVGTVQTNADAASQHADAIIARVPDPGPPPASTGAALGSTSSSTGSTADSGSNPTAGSNAGTDPAAGSAPATS